MEITKTINKADEEILVFTTEEATNYCEIYLEDPCDTLHEDENILIGVFYNNERQIIGINTLNNEKWLKQDESKWNFTFLQIYLFTPLPESMLFKKLRCKQMMLWWNENVRD